MVYFGKFKMATCTTVHVEVMNMSYDFQIVDTIIHLGGA